MSHQGAIQFEPHYKVVIVIHSSSHLKEHRGVARLVRAQLQGKAELIIKAKGGRTWDSALIADFQKINNERKGCRILHIVLLGDNDVRGDYKLPRSMHLMRKFGEAVAASEFKNGRVEIFVNGLIPFPVQKHPNNNNLRHRYYECVTGLVGLVDCSPHIHYVPLKDPFDNYLSAKRLTVGEMFQKDNVHLSKNGEEFLADYIILQARLFAASGHGGLLMKNVVDSRSNTVEAYRKTINEYVV
jgi:hypothetical protein